MIGTTKVKPLCPQGDAFIPPIPTCMKGSPEGFFFSTVLYAGRNYNEGIPEATQMKPPRELWIPEEAHEESRIKHHAKEGTNNAHSNQDSGANRFLGAFRQGIQTGVGHSKGL